MSKDKSKWVSQMISAKTRKMFQKIVKNTKRSVQND